MLSGDELWSLLDETSMSTLGAIFGADLVSDPPGRTIVPGGGVASLGCLSPKHPPEIYTSTDGRIRLRLSDADEQLNLSVTDLRFYESDLVTPATDRVADVSRRLRQGVPVRLSVGVGRPFPPDEPRHWLQVNSIHLADTPIDVVT